MILSNKNKFLFIKTRKVASTAVEIYLSQFCGENDVISNITHFDERLRLHGRICQNFVDSPLIEKLMQLSVIYNKRWAFKFLRSSPLFRKYNFVPGHAGIHYAYQKFGKSNVENFYSFTIERNPYDKALSMAAYQKKKEQYAVSGKNNIVPLSPEETIEVLVNAVDKREPWLKLIRNFDLYAINGEVKVNKVINYDTLVTELNKVTQELNLNLTDVSELPFSKDGLRRKHDNMHVMLPERTKQYIYELCREEFDVLSIEP